MPIKGMSVPAALEARMSPLITARFTPRELASMRIAVAPGRSEAGAAQDLGRAGIAAQLMWRERMGALARTPRR